MRRLLAWLAGLVGGAAAYRAFRRRPEPAGPAPAPDPAEELRAKLAASRAGADHEADEPSREETAASDVEARRRSVHEQARAAIDEMQSD